ncbi:MAG: sulfotransferase [Acidimicrobiales bacterium]
MERFVVGTGRCGSTLLARMLAEHREVVSLHEFFTGLDWERRFAPGVVSGERFAALIGAEQPVTNAVLARGHTSDEIRYPFGAPGARYQPGDPVPWILISMLSHLTDDPDPLFDEVMAFARARPDAPLADHYRSLFELLTERFDGSVWIERSGSSLDYLTGLIDLYPDARFVHIHRDGPEAALSIREHPFFRLGVAFFLELLPERSDAEDEAELISRIIDTPPPCWAVGRFWSDQVLRGFRALPRLNRNQFLQVRFEDLLVAPHIVLAQIATFFELPEDEGFLGRACAMVRTPPPPRLDVLAPGERDELVRACRPGQLLLGRSD